MSTDGIIFDIKKFAVHDGPGIRTTVFFKGCGLDCWWCHNPESRKPGIELLSQKNRSISDQTIGQAYTVDEIMFEILKDKIFYDESGGGVTFSGGEPLLQPDFLLETLQQCKKENLSTAVDTSGYSDLNTLVSILPFTDLFLYDLKLADDDLHKKYTGVSNNKIIENLKSLIAQDANIWARVPLIPGITDTVENLSGIIDLLGSLKSIRTVSILPYNMFAQDKYHRFEMEHRPGDLKMQDDAEINRISQLFNKHGYDVNAGG